MKKFAKIFLVLTLAACLAAIFILPAFADEVRPKFWELPFNSTANDALTVKGNNISALLSDNPLFSWAGSDTAGFKITVKDGANSSSDWSILEFKDVEGNRWQRMDATDGIWLHYNVKITDPSNSLRIYFKLAASDGTRKLNEQSISGVLADNSKKFSTSNETFPAGSGTYTGKIDMISLIKEAVPEFDSENSNNITFESVNLVIEGITATSVGSSLEIGYMIFDDENASNTLNKVVPTTPPTEEPTPSPTTPPTEEPTPTPTTPPTEEPTPTATTSPSEEPTPTETVDPMITTEPTETSEATSTKVPETTEKIESTKPAPSEEDNNKTGDATTITAGLLAAAAVLGGIKLSRRK